MAFRRKKSARMGPRRYTPGEWVGGVSSMPSYVTGEGEPFRPELLLWMDASGFVLGSDVARPSEVLAMVSASFQAALNHPEVGTTQRPTRVRVASPEIAAELRVSHPTLEVICAPTPELDAVFESMFEALRQRGEQEQTFLSSGVEAEVIASFFRAAAALYRAQSWLSVPDDQCIFSLTIEALDVRDHVVSVIGQLGQSYALLLYATRAAFHAYLAAGAADQRGEELEIPPHLALNYEFGTDLSAPLRQEIRAHRWEIAGPSAYPHLVAIDADCIARPPGRRELTVFEALSSALTQVLQGEEKEALRAAWHGAQPFSWTEFVNTHQGPVEVELYAPYRLASGVSELNQDLLAELAAVPCDGDSFDTEAREALEQELLRRFSVSPYGQKIDGPLVSPIVFEYAADYFGHSIAALEVRELRKIVFEVLPRSLSVEPSEAGAIIAELHALYRFLKHEFGFKKADSCLKALSGEAVRKLQKALSDRGQFGIAKLLLQMGADAGFDMQSEQGITAWMQMIQG